jgi:hypothetical protein
MVVIHSLNIPTLLYLKLNKLSKFIVGVGKLRNKLKIINKSLLGIALTFSLSGVYAHQTLEKYTQKTQQPVRNSANELRWLYADQVTPVGNYTPFDLMQGQESEFYLHAYRIDGAAPAGIDFYADLSVLDEKDEIKSDIDMNPKNQCHFKTGEIDMCKVRLTATKQTPIGEKTRQIKYDEAEGSDIDFIGAYKWLNIYQRADGGIIDGIGPDKVINKLTAITTASRDHEKDNIPLTLRVHGSENATRIHLVYAIKDISGIAEIKQSTCDITTFDSQGNGSCFAGEVTPLKMGKTEIILDQVNSSWFSASGEHKYTDLSPVSVHVGALYAGYQKSNMVFRIGSEFTITDQKKGVKSIVIDGVQHKLYAIDGKSVYRQNKINEAPSLNLTNIMTHPSGAGTFDTLSLTDTPNKILLGVANEEVVLLNDSGIPDDWDRVGNMFNSLVGASIDEQTNIGFFSDMNNTLGVYYSKYNDDDDEPKFTTYKNTLDGHYTSMLVAADANLVYASADYSVIADDPQLRSDLFFWEKNGRQQKMVPVKTDNESPFKNRNTITMLRFFHGKLYAGSTNGDLYSLEYPVGAPKPHWKFITHIDGAISDTAVDANNNGYLAAGFAGVWKIPFDNQSPYLLEDYKKSAAVNTVAIDNNR